MKNKHLESKPRFWVRVERVVSGFLCTHIWVPNGYVGPLWYNKWITIPAKCHVCKKEKEIKSKNFTEWPDELINPAINDNLRNKYESHYPIEAEVKILRCRYCGEGGNGGSYCAPDCIEVTNPHWTRSR